MTEKEGTIMDIEAFRKTVAIFFGDLQSIPEEITSAKLAPGVWSLKEIIGHLVDSAANNHQRFIRLQSDVPLNFPGYNQEQWNNMQRYNEFGWYDLVQLWSSYNKLLLHIIPTIEKKHLQNYWLHDDKKLTLEWIINDYYRHLKHHYDQFKQRSDEILKLQV